MFSKEYVSSSQFTKKNVGKVKIKKAKPIKGKAIVNEVKPSLAS